MDFKRLITSQLIKLHAWMSIYSPSRTHGLFPCLFVFTRGKAETWWVFFQPTLCSGSVPARGCGRSRQVSTATEIKAK